MEHQRKPTLLSVYQMESLISFHAFSIRIVLRQIFSFVAKSKLPRRRGKLLSFCLSYVKPLVSFNRLQLLRINKNSEQKLNFVTLCTQSYKQSYHESSAQVNRMLQDNLNLLFGSQLQTFEEGSSVRHVIGI